MSKGFEVDDGVRVGVVYGRRTFVRVRVTAPPLYPAAISSISRSVAKASPRALWSPPGSFWLR